MSEKRISDQLDRRTIDLAKKTYEEILEIVEDYRAAKTSLGRPPKVWEIIAMYDHTLIALYEYMISLRKTAQDETWRLALKAENDKKKE